jgi:hypothetical protein
VQALDLNFSKRRLLVSLVKLALLVNLRLLEQWLAVFVFQRPYIIVVFHLYRQSFIET